MTKEQRKKRTRIGVSIIIAVFVSLALYLVKIQIIDGAEYKAASANLAVTQTTIKASRGEILDTSGNPLVTNRQGYSLVFKYSEFPSYKNQEERNRVIFELIKLFEENDAEWLDRLPVVYNKKGKLVVDKEKEAEFKFMVSESMLELPEGEESTPDECLDALIERYKLQEYSRVEARKIASVCFGMKYYGFSVASPYTFAEDVPLDIIPIVLENSGVFKGVAEESTTYREYSDTTAFSHILGVVGSISAEEYEYEKIKLQQILNDDEITKAEKDSYVNNSYTINDKYGKSGIESVMEEYLRGKNGIKTTTESSDGSVTEAFLLAPEQGATVVTTIDSGLQSVTEKSLAKALKENKNLPYFGEAGAVVVQNVRTGEILACVSYPTFDITKYFSEYDKLSSDGDSPLWNRALLSAYAPGSTMKPAVAIAGLSEKKIDAGSTYNCTNHYVLEDQTFQCLSRHGYLSVTTALEKSCNIYFFELGRELGIDKLNKYSTLLGLGQKTGVELPEASGMLASVANKEANGETWNPGDTVQAAIGQSDNLFTPIQLVNYCSTIANGGTRYKPYMIKSVLSADLSEVIYETTPEVINTLSISEKDLGIVKQGMRQVLTSKENTAHYIFQDCIVEAAGKTGTSQLKRTTDDGTVIDCNNGFFISYAPYDNPEIAVAVVGENVKTGGGMSRVAVDVYNYYFGNKNKFESVDKNNVLIP